MLAEVWLVEVDLLLSLGLSCCDGVLVVLLQVDRLDLGQVTAGLSAGWLLHFHRLLQFKHGRSLSVLCFCLGKVAVAEISIEFVDDSGQSCSRHTSCEVEF